MDEREIVRAIADALRSNPPTIGIIGLSGVGKSSTINALFGTELPVSHTTRGTAAFIESRIPTPPRTVFDTRIEPALHVLDAPGLGEDAELDDRYKRQYKRHLRKCDVVLWVLAARNRALALDQRYLASLRRHLPNLLLGLNQIDLVEPLDWNERTNMPSARQSHVIETIVADRRDRMARFFGKALEVVPYSAEKYFGLHDLFLRCLAHAPPARRWMFDLVRTFSPEDWLSRARGLTEEQRATVVKRYRRQTDARGGLEEVLRRALGGG